MAKHDLKCDPDVFQLTVDGLKPFEIRKADRLYQVGDLLVLKETIFSAKEMALENMPLGYTGRTYECEVVALINGEQYGILPDHVLLLTKQ